MSEDRLKTLARQWSDYHLLSHEAYVAKYPGDERENRDFAIAVRRATREPEADMELADAARAQLEALQHKFDVATTGPIMFPEEANRLRTQVKGLREALLRRHDVKPQITCDAGNLYCDACEVLGATEDS